jgi:leucyl aminopeptidase
VPKARSTARRGEAKRPEALTTGAPPPTPVASCEIRFGAPLAEAADLTVVALARTSEMGREAKALDAQLSGAIASLVASDGWRGDALECTLLHVFAAGAVRPVMLVGLGPGETLTLERVRRAAGAAARRARKLGAPAVEIVFPDATAPARARAHPFPVLAHAFLEGFLLGAYAYAGLKSAAAEPKRRIERVRLVAPKGVSRAQLEAVRLRAVAAAGGVYLARDLAQLPPNVLTPAALGEAAIRLGKRHPALKVTVLDEAAIRKAGMGALLAVAGGSRLAPRFIVLELPSARARARKLALVGKGLTFDSGGLSLKPAQKMELMKYDMCGAAAVLGAFDAAARAGAPVHLVGVIPAAENLPSGTAVRPGDVIDSFSGRTIEVLNTDAEGRLVLADALAYVEKTFRPDAMIDIATLTGAIGIALGTLGAGLFTDDDALARRIEDAALSTGERTWRLPMWEDYDDAVKSDIADVRNVADGGGAGAIVGAVFLRRFVGETPWAHIDMANVAWGEKESHYAPRGPTGYGVRLLMRIIEGWGASPSRGERRS